MCFFLFNRTTLQVFVTYLQVLYMCILCDSTNINTIIEFVPKCLCQRWWFQWRFWFVPSVPRYLREEEEHKPDPWRNPIERNHMGLHLEKEVYDKLLKPPTIISNNPVFYCSCSAQPLCHCHAAASSLRWRVQMFSNSSFRWVRNSTRCLLLNYWSFSGWALPSLVQNVCLYVYIASFVIGEVHYCLL